VITEALRLYSPVWILPRRALADVELGGYLLPPGSRIFFSPYALNHNRGCTAPRTSSSPTGGFAWTESTLLLSAVAARWQLRLADGAVVHPVVSSTLVPSELPVIVTRRR